MDLSAEVHSRRIQPQLAGQGIRFRRRGRHADPFRRRTFHRTPPENSALISKDGAARDLARREPAGRATHRLPEILPRRRGPEVPTLHRSGEGATAAPDRLLVIGQRFQPNQLRWQVVRRASGRGRAPRERSTCPGKLASEERGSESRGPDWPPNYSRDSSPRNHGSMPLWQIEFRDETARLNGAANLDLRLDSIYTRSVAFRASAAGRIPLRTNHRQRLRTALWRRIQSGNGLSASAVAVCFRFPLRG